jgi:regulator of sigma E protease
MLDLAVTIGAFIVAILILVAVHEFGHFWVARVLGVKVLRFSIGFGKSLLTWRRRGDPTEYVIAAVPLGGYVKMLDEREDEVPPDELHRAFNRQKLWKRTAIVLAGPLFNFLFAIAVYWGVLIVGEQGLRPEVGTVLPGSIAAEAGFQPGDQVLAVAGRETQTWSAVWFSLLSEALDGEDLPVQVRAQDGDEVTRVLDGDSLAELDPGRGFLSAIGLQSVSAPIPPVIGEIVDGEPAARSGLRVGDVIVSVDGVSIDHWRQFVEVVQQHPDQAIAVGVQRDGSFVDLTLTPRTMEADTGSVGRIGAGVEVPELDLDEYQVIVRYGPLGALVEAGRRVGDISVLTLRIIGRMLIGSASVENISSPIGIADTAGKTASFGIEAFVKFLALLSVSLGLLNLLPIPILDGGHLLYFAYEGITGRPLSEEVQAQGQRIGLVLILSLMTLAFYVDIARLLG